MRNFNLFLNQNYYQIQPEDNKEPQSEDARLFSFKKKIFIIFNDNDSEIGGQRRDTFISDLLIFFLQNLHQIIQYKEIK